MIARASQPLRARATSAARLAAVQHDQVRLGAQQRRCVRRALAGAAHRRTASGRSPRPVRIGRPARQMPRTFMPYFSRKRACRSVWPSSAERGASTASTMHDSRRRQVGLACHVARGSISRQAAGVQAAEAPPARLPARRCRLRPGRCPAAGHARSGPRARRPPRSPDRPRAGRSRANGLPARHDPAGTHARNSRSPRR